MKDLRQVYVVLAKTQNSKYFPRFTCNGTLIWVTETKTGITSKSSYCYIKKRTPKTLTDKDWEANVIQVLHKYSALTTENKTHNTTT